jgi:nucleotide-binding universal stress UspA family protein
VSRTILCPVDFSPASRGALRYALAIAEQTDASVTLLLVHDPTLAEAAELKMGGAWLAARGERELNRFVSDAGAHRPSSVEVRTVVDSGKPASRILEHAERDKADLIVMGSRGNSGVRKFFFGATTERVLREAACPILVIPADDAGPADPEALKKQIHHVLVPVDLTGGPIRHVDVAGAIAQAVHASLIIAHVVEPIWFATAVQPQFAGIDSERRHRAETALATIASRVSPTLRSETLTTFGDPAEELAKIATDRQVGLIVMGLHASTGGRRMGSVTYRVLCLAQTLVLAVPPA